VTITGVAAGVPFTALPPAHGGPAPLVVTWHLLDAPRSDAAFAAALPMAGLPAWRVHLGLPMCGSRMVDGSMDAVVDAARSDALRTFADGISRQALDEFPAALTELRARFPVTDAPLGLVGGSLGGLVVLRVLTAGVAPVSAVALVNPLIRARSVVPMVDPTYSWDPASNALADELDFVARAADITVPLLLVSGEDDHAQFRVDAADLSAAAPSVELRTVPGLAHPLAEEPGIEPAPQGELAKVVDDALTAWFVRHVAPR
jgi:pimeloyl-ACP methyl ester carboxylesterase